MAVARESFDCEARDPCQAKNNKASKSARGCRTVKSLKCLTLPPHHFALPPKFQGKSFQGQ